MKVKVICIDIQNNPPWWNLTIDKIYDSCEVTHERTIYIVDDSGLGRYYPRSCFITLDEYRNQKLEDIGI